MVMKEKSIWHVKDFEKISTSRDAVIFRGIENSVKIQMYDLVTSFYDPATHKKILLYKIMVIVIIMFSLALLLLVFVMIRRRKNFTFTTDLQRSLTGDPDLNNLNNDDFGTNDEFLSAIAKSKANTGNSGSR